MATSEPYRWDQQNDPQYIQDHIERMHELVKDRDEPLSSPHQKGLRLYEERVGHFDVAKKSPYLRAKYSDCDCSDCEEKMNVLLGAREDLRKVIDRLYDDKPLDILALENDLDELCWQLGLKLNPKDLLIGRTKPIKIHKL